MGTGAGRGPVRLHVEVNGVVRQVTVEPVNADATRVAVSWGDTRHVVDVAVRPGALSVILGDPPRASHEVAYHEIRPGALVLAIDGRRVMARVNDGRLRRSVAATGSEGDHAVTAPMPGRVVRAMVEPGDVVRRGQGIIVVEAMKMENELAAPVDGVVSDVRVTVGETVESGAILAVVSAGADDD